MEAYRYPSPRRPVAPVPVPVLRVDTLSRQVSKLSRGSSRRSRSTQQTQQQEQQEPGNGPYSFADYARRLDTYRQRWGRAPLERISEFNHFVDERFACFEGTPVSEFAPSNFSSTLNVPLSAVEESKTELIEPTPEQEEGKYVTGLALVLLLIGLSLSVFLIALDMTIIGTAIPEITDEFKSVDQVGWYGSAYFLTNAAFQSTWGKGFKYFPLKTVFLIAIFIFEVGSLICGVANSSTTLIIGRAIAGAGSAGGLSGAYLMIGASAPPKKVPAYTGAIGASFVVSSVLGPLLGGVFTTSLSWRWCFYINLPVGGVSAALIVFIFKNPKALEEAKVNLREKVLQMDPLGTVLILGSLVALLLVLQWGGVTKKWKDPSVIGTLVAFVVLLVLFVIGQWWNGERALVVPRLVKQRTLALLMIYQFINGAVFAMPLYYIPIYFQTIDGVSPSQSGIRNIPMVLGTGFATAISGALVSSFGHYIPLMNVGGVLATVGAGLYTTWGLHTPSSQWIAYQAIQGIGIGLSFQVPVIVAQTSAAIADVTSATAMIFLVQCSSATVFISVAQSIFANRLVKAVTQSLPELDPRIVLATGATELRKVFPPSQLPAVLDSYMVGLRDVFIFLTVLAGVPFIISIIFLIFDRKKLDIESTEKGIGAMG